MGTRIEAVVETLPVGDPSGRSEERLDSAKEERLTSLFRRWPALTDEEVSELRGLWEERIQIARQDR
jgi:hypothetical protein